MSSANFDFDPANLPDATLKSFGIVVSDWNSKITSNLLNGCLEFLRKKNANYAANISKTQLFVSKKSRKKVISIGSLRYDLHSI